MWSRNIILFNFLLIVHSITAQSLNVDTLNGTLPSPRLHVQSIYDGYDSIYIFGGFDTEVSYFDEILKYSITADTVTKVSSFPAGQGRGQGAVAIDDKTGNIFYLGGYIAGSTKEVYMFDPSKNSTTLVGNLTEEANGLAAVKYSSASSEVYLIGGSSNHGYIGNIVQCFDMSTVSPCANYTNQEINSGFSGHVAVSYENNAYIFGSGSATGKQVYKLNLDAFNSTTGDELPSLTQRSTTATIAGSKAYIVGGYTETDAFGSSGIVQVDLMTLKVTYIPVEGLGEERDFLFADTSAVYVEKLNRIYLFGGIRLYNIGGQLFDKVRYIDLSPLDV